MMKFSRAVVFFICIFTAVGVSAQTPVEVDYALNLIDSTNALIKLRSDRFNEEITKVNSLNVLDVASLGKSILSKNAKKVKDFVDFLDVSRSLSRQSMHALEDSVANIKERGLTKKMMKPYDDLVKAYESDQKAFDQYTLALSKVFTNVVKILSYLDTCDYTIKDKKLIFTERAQSEKYGALFTELEESQKKAAYAGADSQKSSIDARDMVHKIYDEIQK
jgi:hypothetical protein